MHGQVVPGLARLLQARVGDAVARAEDAVLALAPQGGQARSRRNARLAVADEAALAAARWESDQALGTAWVRARAEGHLHPAPPVSVGPLPRAGHRPSRRPCSPLPTAPARSSSPRRR